MPTTTEETLNIGKIIQQYVEPEKIGPLIKHLVEVVGYNTWNYSVRKSLFDLYRSINPDWNIPDEIFLRLYKMWDNGPVEYTDELWAYEFCGIEQQDYSQYMNRLSHKLI